MYRCLCASVCFICILFSYCIMYFVIYTNCYWKVVLSRLQRVLQVVVIAPDLQLPTSAKVKFFGVSLGSSDGGE